MVGDGGMTAPHFHTYAPAHLRTYVTMHLSPTSAVDQALAQRELLGSAGDARASALARTSDRNKPMDIDAGRSDYSMDDSRPTTLSGGVVITQGTPRHALAMQPRHARDEETEGAEQDFQALPPRRTDHQRQRGARPCGGL